jgi:hypothetical protein
MSEELEAAQAAEALHDSNHPDHSNAVNALATALSGDPEAEPVMIETKPDVSAGTERLDEMLSAGMDDVAVPADYSFAKLELPEGELADPVEMQTVSEWMWSCEIPQALASGLQVEYSKCIAMTPEQREERYRQTYTSLQQRYGDKVDEAISLASSAILAAGGQAAVDFLQESDLGSSHALIEHLISLSRRRGVEI